MPQSNPPNNRKAGHFPEHAHSPKGITPRSGEPGDDPFRNRPTRGIADGDPARVFNNRGECSFLARVSDNTQAGLLAADGLHWPSLSPSGGANQLTSQRLTDMGETCAFHCNLVEVQPQGN